MVQHSSRIELSQSAFKKNISFIRERVGAHAQLTLVLKANAYGHGVEQVVSMAEKSGVDHFAVASSQEAQAVLQSKSPGSDIMIMGILYDQDLPWVIENDIEFYVFDIPSLENTAAVAKSVGKPGLVHLEIETGGYRTGLDTEELPRAVEVFKSNKKNLTFSGLCTHLAGAETVANQFRIKKQLDVFNSVRTKLKHKKVGPRRYHVASSAAALAMPEAAFDLVRVGTAAYGLWPSPDVYNLHLMQSRSPGSNPLKRVITWKTNVMHLKKVPRDAFVGYGTSYQAFRDMTTAVIPIGYANGYPREMSNRGHVLIRGKKAPVVGVVNMNMFIVDVTSIPGVEVGDEVVLVGRQKNNVIGLRSFSEFSHSLNTEFVSRLPSTIPRTIVR